MSFEKERRPWKNANVKRMRRIFFLVVEAHLFKVLKVISTLYQKL